MSISELSNLVVSVYDRIASGYTEAYSENDEQDFKYFDEFIAKLSGKKLIDMGCGSGVNTAFFKKNGFDIIGIDASANMLEIARKINPKIQFEKQDILHTSFDANIFDGVVLAYVINHFNQNGLILLKTEIDRILKNGGLLFVSAHVGDTDGFIPDPLDNTIKIYYNFLVIDVLDELFSGYKREFFNIRSSYSPEEFLCDKMFIVYRKAMK